MNLGLKLRSFSLKNFTEIPKKTPFVHQITFFDQITLLEKPALELFDLFFTFSNKKFLRYGYYTQQSKHLKKPLKPQKSS